jgi:hypothetical protein
MEGVEGQDGVEPLAEGPADDAAAVEVSRITER